MKRDEAEPVVTLLRPVLFWMGTAAIAAGVLSHAPMFMHAASMGYRMVGTPMDDIMIAGMFGIVGGVVVAFYGVLPACRAGDAQRRCTWSCAHMNAVNERREWAAIRWIPPVEETIDGPCSTHWQPDHLAKAPAAGLL